MSDTTFMTSPSLFLTSESVTEGHPDKLCDQISDAILDAFIRQDSNARVACETAVTTGLVLVLGEISLAEGYVDIPGVVREVIKDVGYTRAKYGFDYETCGVSVSLKEQSSDIAQGVDKSLEVREGEGEAAELEQGAGDQGMMIGFACHETPELMPLTISLAHKLCRRMAHVRKEGVLDYLRPDGKSQVTVEYEYGKPKRIDAIVLSSQHDPVVSHEQMERDFRDVIIDEVIAPGLIDEGTRVYVNPTGRFVIGGPMGDAGLTGRKIIVDSYGGIARHGGGAFSGKDPTKVDRSAAYAARYVAKNVVAAGLADRAEFQLSYAIGVARPTSMAIETFGTGRVDDETILHLVNENFDLRPAAIIRDLDLRRPIYRPTASYGHFGRDDIEAPWERTDRAEKLQRGAGLAEKEALLEAGA
jgi:S-adenosylmethionine synthetase